MQFAKFPANHSSSSYMVYYTIKSSTVKAEKITVIMLKRCIFVCFAILSCGDFVISTC